MKSSVFGRWCSAQNSAKVSTAQCRHDGNQVFRVDLLPTMVRVGILHQILIYLSVLSIIAFLAIGRPY